MLLIYNSSRSRAEAFNEPARFNRNSCSEFIPQSTLNTPENKAKRIFTSKRGFLCLRRSVRRLLNYRRTSLKYVRFFLVKKTYFPFVAVSQRCEITYSFISPRAQNGSRLIQARFRASSGGLLTKIRNTAQHRSVQ